MPDADSRTRNGEELLYKARGAHKGDLTVRLDRSGTITEIQESFPVAIPRTKIYQEFGKDALTAHFSLAKCAGNALYRDPRGAIELTLYPSRGIVLWPDQYGYDFAAIHYLAHSPGLTALAGLRRQAEKRSEFALTASCDYTVWRRCALRVRILLSAVLLLSIFACRSNKPPPPSAGFRSKAAWSPSIAAAHTITLDHHEIAGYMKAMTMAFPVHDAWVFKVVHPGDTVQATLVVADDAIWKTSRSPRPAPRRISPPLRPCTFRSRASRFRIFISSTRRAHDSSGAVPRRAAADHVYLFPLPPPGLLHPHEQ